MHSLYSLEQSFVCKDDLQYCICKLYGFCVVVMLYSSLHVLYI
jgi:hypothetical protein